MIDRLISGLFRVYILLSILFILMPILTLVVFSFNINRHPRLPWSEFSFIWYEAMWNDPAMQSGFVNSLIVAVCVAAIATFIGFCTAYLDYRFRFRGKIAILAIFFMPPTIPIVILGMVFLVYLAKVGLFGEIHSVVIGHVAYCAPFAMALVRMRLAQMDENLEAAAWNLGASEWTTIREIIIPFTRPAIIAALFLTMAVSFDEYMIAWFVSGLNETLPARILAVLQGQVTPQINAVGSVVFVISISLVLVAQFVLVVRRPQSERNR